MRKKPSMNINGQTIIFSFILALLASILVTSMALLWQADVQTTSLFRDGMVAFYIAQAGIERGKAELMSKDTAGGDAYTGDINETFAGGYYNVSIRDKGSDKYCFSRGHFKDSERRINLTIGRNASAAPGGNAWGWYKKANNTWEEE